ncbi:MAG: cysteine-rich CWC family protein [Bacteroidales bacterium]|jgi:ribosomal protein L34E
MNATIKKCEKCGKEFHCLAGTNQVCWCTRYKLTDEQLKKLEELYEDCLCEDCLKEFAEKG